MRKTKAAAGYTLIEMVVVLIILSVVVTGIAVFGETFLTHVRRQAFEEEAQRVCRFYNDSRKIAMMAAPGTYVRVNIDLDRDKLTRYSYEGENKQQHIEKLSLNELKLYSVKGTIVRDITFTNRGTISRGTTYQLKGVGGNNCYLVIQPVTGLMYLSNTKPKS